MGDFSKGGVHKTDGFWWILKFSFIASKNQALRVVIFSTFYDDTFAWLCWGIFFKLIFRSTTGTRKSRVDAAGSAQSAGPAGIYDE